MTKYLDSFYIKNYRSLGKDGVRLVDLSDINIIIGQNNGGKSNILRSLYLWEMSRRGSGWMLNATDYYDNDSENKIEYGFGSAKDDLDFFNDILDGNIPFVDYRVDGQSIEVTDSFVHRVDDSKLHDFTLQKTNGSSSVKEANVQTILGRQEFRNLFDFPPVIFVEESRVRQSPKDVRDLLEPIWHHGAANRALRPIKKALKDFIESAFDSSIEIQFEPGGDSFSISTSEESLITYDSLGSGFRQIFSLGLLIASTQDSIVMIDEPELNMHPSLLRRLMKLILSNESNQYIIATHSNVLLDGGYEKSIYKVRGGDFSQVTRIDSIDEVRELLDDLGVKASDLLQTNGVIWVEGPSDRTYIKKWLELIGSNRVEGLDYSFQYYGGKLLAHYTLDDDLEEFVNVLDINRNAYVVLDSDWKDDSRGWATSDLAPRKKRIIQECESKNIPYWISSGVEIENYIPDSVWTSYSGSNIKLGSHENITDKISKYNQKALESHKVAELLEKSLIDTDEELIEVISKISESIETWNKI